MIKDLDYVENLAIAMKDLAAFHKIVADEEAVQVYRAGNEMFETDVGRVWVSHDCDGDARELVQKIR